MRREQALKSIETMLEKGVKKGWGKRYWPKTSVKHGISSMAVDGTMTTNPKAWRESLTNYFSLLFDAAPGCRINVPMTSAKCSTRLLPNLFGRQYTSSTEIEPARVITSLPNIFIACQWNLWNTSR
eukprot:6298385-Heterocapsa_arctica.AAC.1